MKVYIVFSNHDIKEFPDHSVIDKTEIYTPDQFTRSRYCFWFSEFKSQDIAYIKAILSTYGYKLIEAEI